MPEGLGAGPFVAYVDGSSSGAWGPGGYGVVLRAAGGRTVERAGGDSWTTNQRMEIVGAIVAVRELDRGGQELLVYSDSAYVVDCIRQGWWRKWRTNGWRNSKKEDVSNRDLWTALLWAIHHHGGPIDFEKIPGHQTKDGPHKAGNDRADALAGAAKRAIEGMEVTPCS